MDAINWTTVFVAFLATIPAAIGAVAILLPALKAYHAEVNGMKTALIQSTKEAATAEATLAEQGAERERKAIKDKASVEARKGDDP